MQTTTDVRTSDEPATPRPPAASGGGRRSLVARKLAGLIERAVADSGISCAVTLASGETLRFGPGEPQFTVTFHSDKPLLGAMSEDALGQAYVNGEFDLEGDMLAMQEVRKLLAANANPGLILSALAQMLLLPATLVNKRAIASHYQLGDDFYLAFMDERYRFYTHCLYHHDGETLEEAAEHKLETMWNGLGLRPGMRLLDIGGGWGGVHEYCGPRGVSVTSLTIGEDSYKYITELDRRMGLDHCTVRLEDFLQHEPEQPYDGVVMFGVIEHIPYYRRAAARLWKSLKTGGRLYLDASASVQKYNSSDFTRRYVWSGAHSFLCLQDLVRELLYHGLDVLETKNESRDYMLTMLEWAKRFERKRDELAARWGEEITRVFRMYLWSGAYAFGDGSLQAYHLVAEKRAERGPRPGAWKRAAQFVQSLR